MLETFFWNVLVPAVIFSLGIVIIMFFCMYQSERSAWPFHDSPIATIIIYDNGRLVYYGKNESKIFGQVLEEMIVPDSTKQIVWQINFRVEEKKKKRFGGHPGTLSILPRGRASFKDQQRIVYSGSIIDNDLLENSPDVITKIICLEI